MIIVLGKDGMLGTYIFHYLKNNMNQPVIGLTRKTLDATNIDHARTFLPRLITKGDVIINCIGITNKRPDVSVSDMYTINSLFPHLLGKICRRQGAELIHPSTDCVFSGEKGSYQSFDESDATDNYGVSKALAENCHASVIRVSIIGQEWSSRKTGLLEWCKSNRGKTVNGYTNHYWNGITCLEYAKLVKRMIDTNRYWLEPINFCSPQRVSKYQLICWINNVFDLDMTINPIETEKTIDKSLYGTTIYNSLLSQLIELKNYKIDTTNGISMNLENYQGFNQGFGKLYKFDRVFPDNLINELQQELSEKNSAIESVIGNRKKSENLLFEYFTTTKFLMELYKVTNKLFRPDEVGWLLRSGKYKAGTTMTHADSSLKYYCLTLFVGEEKCTCTFGPENISVNVYPGTVIFYPLEKLTSWTLSDDQIIYQTFFC